MDFGMFVRLSRREMRGGLKGVWTFLGCLALGVAAIAAVGSLAAAFRSAVEGQAALITGGDVAVSQSHTPLAPQELAVLKGLGRVSEVMEMRAMASRLEGEPRRTLASLKAVDEAYPLRGEAVLSTGELLGSALALRDGLYGVVVHPDLLARLGLKVGDRMAVGDAEFQVRATILQEPDRAFRLLAFGPRAVISSKGMEATGLLLPGSLVRYEYRLLLPDAPGAASDPDLAAARLKAELKDPGVRIRTASEVSPTVGDGFRRLAGLMSLVGLSALLLGGLGVFEAVAGYLDSKTATIATFKAIGASSRTVFWIFFPQIMLLACAGVLAGVAVGALAGLLAGPLLADVLPVAPVSGVYPKALGLAALFGLLTAVACSVPPLSSRTRVGAMSLFRGYTDPRRPRPGRAALAVSAACGLALALLVLATSPNRLLGWGFLGSVAACAVAFRALAWVMSVAARAVPLPSDPRAALAIRGFSRPGNPSGSVVACLGLGLTVLAAVSLSDANFQYAMRSELPEQAPSFFFLDVQPYQIDEFTSLVSSVPGVERVEKAPSLRGRIVSVKGVPVDQLAVAENVTWAVRGDRSLTWAREMPHGAKLEAGKWWPQDYSGPPLVSMDAEVAQGLGLKVGDRLTVSVYGREIELTVSSLRRIRWLSLALNHVFVLSPGVIEDQPMTYLATAYVSPTAPEAAEEVYRRVGARFGNVSVQRVDEALADVGNLAEQIAVAVRASAVVTLLAGLLVLAQSLRASMGRRIYEAVIYKVCGATRADIMAVMLGEYGLAGLAAGLAALILGAGLSWFFVTQTMQTSWGFFAAPVALTLGLGIALTLGMAMRSLWRMLSSKAWPHLRNE
ncbi:ABC transporter permease [Fundidesulfovibrio soli]|uniref:ABC transporter permease n=1 Tax=Fundidesulfovibrio soli TaxID=2922716 RepID=UPI001FAEB53C|nr:FtsX-like permease family protein [Fundidesulfovibrio soli]